MHTIINEWWAIATVAAIRTARTPGETARLWRELRLALLEAWAAEAIDLRSGPSRLRTPEELRERALLDQIPQPLGCALWALAVLVQENAHVAGGREAALTLAAAHPAILAGGLGWFRVDERPARYGVEIPKH